MQEAFAQPNSPREPWRYARSVLVRAAGDVPRMANSPSPVLEGSSFGVVRLGQEECELERLARVVR
jgi:hypothetical protein